MVFMVKLLIIMIVMQLTGVTGAIVETVASEAQGLNGAVVTNLTHGAGNAAKEETENPEHLGGALGVQGQRNAPDAGRFGFLRIDAPEGRQRHVVPGSGQLPAELENVGLRPADIHGHGYHKDFHVSILFLIEGWRGKNE